MQDYSLDKEVYKSSSSDLEEVKRLSIIFDSLTDISEMEENIHQREKLLGLK